MEQDISICPFEEDTFNFTTLYLDADVDVENLNEMKVMNIFRFESNYSKKSVLYEEDRSLVNEVEHALSSKNEESTLPSLVDLFSFVCDKRRAFARNELNRNDERLNNRNFSLLEFVVLLIQTAIEISTNKM